MQLSEKATFNNLPRVKNFSFFISGISLSDFNPVSFKFVDTGLNYFSFDFENGFLKTDKTIYLYNNKELINIEGYIQNNKLYYKINEIFSEKNLTFSSLDKIIIDNINTEISFDLFVNSEPINYSFEVNETYPFTGILSGKIFTDIPFYIKDYSFLFKNSNAELLSGENNLTGRINSGNNTFTLKDIDISNFEYLNLFSINFRTIFGNLFNNFFSYRGNFYDKEVISLTENAENIYEQSLLFDGIWSQNKFFYSKNVQNYNLNYFIQHFDHLGNSLPTTISVIFEPLNPLNNAYYASEYITGFQLINSGLYSGEAPQLSFSKYYYVDGISQSLSNLLFSADCENILNINYSGNSTGQASGFLNLKNVRLNNFYGNGINVFKAAFDYISYSKGSGYTGSPIIIWGTGGNCFSLADVYGESGQFKKIHNTRSKIKAHSDYLNGTALTKKLTDVNNNTTGFIVTGLEITNIGSGYNAIFPPKVNFIRSESDFLNNDASGILLYKQSGLYDFTGFYSINYNFYDLNTYYLNNYNGYYSGQINVPFDKNFVSFNINLSGLDNTNSISGLLTIKTNDGLEQNIIESYIVNNRYYNTN